MTNVEINTNHKYEVIIEKGGIASLGNLILQLKGKKKILVVTDDNVEKLWLEKVLLALKNSSFETFSCVLKNGEENKTPSQFLKVISMLEKNKFCRDDIVVAVGGGIVTDIAGFASATYMRGIDYVSVPTTLLAMVDASVGGKTGVDLPTGKNLLGAFHQPSLVLCDTLTLSTLKDVDWKNGIAEGIKYAVLNGGELETILTKGLDESNIERFVELCVIAKKQIVEKDECENGQRKLLNLGHTFGHAIEQLSNFQIPHGLAVAKGMNLIANFAVNEDKLSKAEMQKLMKMFEKYHFDLKVESSVTKIVEAVKMDKKSDSQGEVSLIVPHAFGNCKIEKIKIEDLKEKMSWMSL